MKSKKKKLVISIILIFFLALICSAVILIYYFTANKDKDTEKESQDYETDIEERDLKLDYWKFADYKLEDIQVTPNVKQYEVKKDLSNVYYVLNDDPDGNFQAVINNELNQNQKSTLAEDLFIITPDNYKEFFTVYEQNRYAYVPSFITTDAFLHTYHLMFDSILKSLEEEFLIPQTTELTSDMVQASLDQYNSLENDDLKIAAKRNVAFFSVANALLDSNFEIPDIVQTEVNEELDRIEAHDQNFLVSEVIAIGFEDPNELDNLKEDYTQYIPRGHYTKSDELKQYFKAMMWLGRMTFLAKSQTTTNSALLITNILNNEQETFDKWEGIYAPITFFVGKADDLTHYEYSVIYKEIIGTKDLNDISADDLDKFWDETKKLTPPQINSIPIFDKNIQPDKEEEIKGFRFMGQRFTVDAMIFQNLIYREVDETETGDRKMLPSSLEIPSAMGDTTAESIIKEDTDFYKYPNYEEQLTNLKSNLNQIEAEKWTQNLYWSWIFTLNGFVGETQEGYPQFMLTDMWDKKELNTYVASWTELKHDTILYSKQVYAEMGDMPPENPPDDKGYVEPNIEVWNRLLGLINMTQDGLEQRDLIDSYQSNSDNSYLCSTIESNKEKVSCNLQHMEYSVQNLIDISVKELKEESLTKEEYDFIKYIGGDLEDMFMSTIDPDSDAWTAIDDNPAMLVADVATGGDVVLEEATGYINNIYVLVPVEGKLRIAKGAVYSQYEFEMPVQQRLTDEKWREMLENGEQPEMLDWQKSLITE